MSLKSPCIDCGELSHKTRCEECGKAFRRKQTRPNATQKGYDKAWRKLSQEARRLQPFCSDCGATTDLQCDHSPEAWRRREQGKRIRLQDVDVVCGPCNRLRGAARGKGAEARESPSNGNLDTLGGVPLKSPTGDPVGKERSALYSWAIK